MRKTGKNRAHQHNTITLNDIHISENTIRYSYHVEGRWKKCFHLNDPMEITYSQDISTTPPSIAAIPFLCNILPIVWLMDATVFIDEIDQDFFESIDQFKQGYIDMYPMCSFKGDIITKKITSNAYEPSEKTALFYSGGLDSIHALIEHKDEKPTLITLLGADVKTHNTEGINNIEALTHHAQQAFHTDSLFIQTNFRTMINERYLDTIVRCTRDGWWHGFQHGIAIIGHAAPFAYINHITTLYRANTYVGNDIDTITCASFQGIDDRVRMAGTGTILCGTTAERLEKIQTVCTFLETHPVDLDIVSCWDIGIARNCCKCEKCTRTMIDLLLSQHDPHDYGYEDVNITEMERNIKSKYIIKTSHLNAWRDRQQYYRSHQQTIDPDGQLNWIDTLNIERINQHPYKIFQRMIRQLKKMIKIIIYRWIRL